MRHLLVHHHLFKNAGSTVDYILSRHFGETWATIESGTPWGLVVPGDFEAMVRANPSLRAISSHQTQPPAPAIEDVCIHPIVFVRDPIDRAASVYAFERTQPPHLSPGAAMAGKSDLRTYFDWRLEEGDGGVVCNFQTMFLGWRPGDADMRAARTRAMDYVSSRGVCIVERFEESMSRMAAALPSAFGRMDIAAPAMNRNPTRAGTQPQRVLALREALGPARFERLEESNRLDIALYAHALACFDAASS